MILKRIPKQDYDEQFRVNKDEKILCYSKKQLECLYPNADAYKIIGETTKNNKKEKIAELVINDNETYVVSAYDGHNGAHFKTVGYVCVGEDQYIALLENRFIFMILCLCMVAGIVVALLLLWLLVINPAAPVISPEHPLPEPDPYVEEIEEDDTEKMQSDQGGGSVSMIYTLTADLSLSTGKANIYFMNPNASNHDVMVQLCIVSGEEDVLIAESGLVQAGYGLYTMTMIEDAAVLSEGVYDAVYKVLYYDSLTGEKALVESTITDVALTVTN